MSQTHIISRQIWDVGYDNESRAHQLQNKLSALSEGGLPAVIQQVLDRYVSPDKTLRFNRIELDLGTIPESMMEEEILERVGRELEAYLNGRIPGEAAKNAEADRDTISTDAYQLELVEWYLARGTLPWWARDTRPEELGRIIDRLLRDRPQPLADLVRRYNRSRGFIQRLVITFTDAQIESLIRKLEPAEAELVIAVGRKTIEVEEQQRLVKTDRRTFRNKVWEFILTYLLDDRGSVFNTKVFVRSLLAQLASHFNKAFVPFVGQFQEAILRMQRFTPMPDGLVVIISEIYEEAVAETASPDSANAEAEERAWFIRFLEQADWIENPKVLERVRPILEKALSNRDREIALLLTRLLAREEAVQWIQAMELSPAAGQTLEQLEDISNTLAEEVQASSEALFAYWQRGSLPAVYGKITRDDLLKVAADLIAARAPEIRQFLFREGPREAVRIRLTSDLSETQLRDIVQLIEPGGAPVILRVADNLQSAKEKGYLKVSASDNEFRQVRWQVILQVLLVDRGSRFNLKTFVRATLTQLAARFRMEYQELVSMLLTGLRESGQDRSEGDLASVLLELADEEAAVIQQVQEEQQQVRQLQVKLDWFRFVVERMGSPWWGQKHGLALSDFQAILTELTTPYFHEVRTVLLRHLPIASKRVFALAQLEEEGMFQLVRIVQPEAEEQVRFYTTVLDRLQDSGERLGISSRFEKQKWDVIIFALVTHRGSRFNFKRFVLDTLHQMAHHFNATFEVLFAELIQITQELASVQGTELAKVVAELEQDWQKQQQSAPSPKEKKLRKIREAWAKVGAEPHLEELVLLLHYFQSKTSWTFVHREALVRWLNDHSYTRPDSLRLVFEHLGFREEDVARLFRQLSPKEQRPWIMVLAAAEQPVVRGYLTDLEQLLPVFTAVGQTALLQRFQARSVRVLLRESGFDKHRFFQELMHELMQAMGLTWEQLQLVMSSAIPQYRDQLISTLPLSFSRMAKVDAETLFAQWEAAERQALGLELDEAGMLDELPRSGLPDLTARNRELLERAWAQEPENQQEQERLIIPYKEEKAPEPGDQLPVTNAGVVMLWPFLTQYFSMLDLLEDEAFKDEASAIRAAHLIQYLVTGQENHPEFDLLLNKLLCGLAPELPIETELALTDKEKEVSNSLLLGVIGNWPNMTDTTIEALQEGFLQRDGVITFNEDSFSLTVEKKTLDILLETLPWSYGIVHLPWMDKVMQVTWT